MEKFTRVQVKQPVNDLKDGLLKLNNPSYNNIDKLMRKIMKKYALTAKELHYGFRNLNDDKTPDEWIKEKKKMKTFEEFIEESYQAHKHFSSKDDLIKHYGGKIPSHLFIKNRGTKESPKYGLASRASREKSSQKREERIGMTTGQLTPKEKRKVQHKRQLAKQRGKEIHHATEIETSAREMEHMSPGQRLRHKSKQAKQHKYSGDSPRNLVLANKGSVKDFKPQDPGFHHGKYHAFERKYRSKLKDIESTISPMRAFTTLVNKERRKAKKSKELQSRMDAAAKKLGLK